MARRFHLDGDDDTVLIQHGGFTYRANPSIVGSSQLNVTTPLNEVVVTAPYANSYLPQLVETIPDKLRVAPNIVLPGNYQSHDTSSRKFIRNIVNNILNNSIQEPTYIDFHEPFNFNPNYSDSYGHDYDNVTQVSSGWRGRRNLLEMLGMVKDKNGNYHYRNPNYNKNTTEEQKEANEWAKIIGTEDNTREEYLRWCAENANMINRALGAPTSGHAWTRHGIYGDSAIVVAPYKKTDWQYKFVPKAANKARSMAKDQAEYVKKHIDDSGVELKSGDIVDMRYPGSSFAEEAWNTGDIDRTNSHTGTILKTGPGKHNTYVAHYFGGKMQVEPIGDLLGVSWSDPYITGIRRPKKKPNNKYTLK